MGLHSTGSRSRSDYNAHNRESDHHALLRLPSRSLACCRAGSGADPDVSLDGAIHAADLVHNGPGPVDALGRYQASEPSHASHEPRETPHDASPGGQLELGHLRRRLHDAVIPAGPVLHKTGPLVMRRAGDGFPLAPSRAAGRAIRPSAWKRSCSWRRSARAGSRMAAKRPTLSAAGLRHKPRPSGISHAKASAQKSSRPGIPASVRACK